MWRPAHHDSQQRKVNHTPALDRRAGNGTRSRDPNLGKVVLYQLSYSRTLLVTIDDAASRDAKAPVTPVLHWLRCSDGGEGNRTPDLVNAIHALSQLSYAPGDGRVRRGTEANRLEPRSIAVGIRGVNEMGLAKTSAASILQRLLGSSPTSERTADLSQSRGC